MNQDGKLVWLNGEISIFIPHRYVDLSRFSFNNWGDDDATYAFSPFLQKQVDEIGLITEKIPTGYRYNRYKYRNKQALYIERANGDHYEISSPNIAAFSKFIGLFGFLTGTIKTFHRETVINESHNYPDCEFFRHYEYFIGPEHEMRLIALTCPESLSLL